MRTTYLTVFFTFVSLISFGQNEGTTISIAATYLTSTDTIFGYFQNRNLDYDYILDYGDGTKILIDKDYQSTGFRHVYSKAGDYVVNFMKMNNDATKTVLDTKTVSLKKPRNYLHITRVELKKYYPVKDSGDTWDNGFGGTFPDVYFILYHNDTNKTFFTNLNNLAMDLKNNTPVIWDVDLKIGDETLSKGISIAFYDNDNMYDHDFMGGVGFPSKTTVNAFFKEDNGTVAFGNLEKTKVLFEITYAWE